MGAARAFLRQTGKVKPTYFSVRLYEIEGGFYAINDRYATLEEAEEAFKALFLHRSRRGGEWRIDLLQRNPQRTLAHLDYSNYDEEIVYDLQRGVSVVQAVRAYNTREREEQAAYNRAHKEVPADQAGSGPFEKRSKENSEQHWAAIKKHLAALKQRHRQGCRCTVCRYN